MRRFRSKSFIGFLLTILLGIIVIPILANTLLVDVRVIYIKQYIISLWNSATTNFTAELLRNLLIAIIIAALTGVMSLFRKNIRDLILNLVRSDEEKLILRDLRVQESDYLVDLKRLIENDINKGDRWNINKYVDLNYVSGDDTEPELREFRVRVWKLPDSSSNPNKQYIIDGEPAKQGGIQLADYLDRERRLVIKGEPGSGKTITIRKIAISAIEKAQQDPSAPLPVLVELNRYRALTSSKEPLDVLEFLKNYFRETHPEAAFLNADLEKTLQHRSVLFLFDGVNEMPPDDYLERIRKLENFSNIRRKHYFVFTCRTLHFDPLLSAKTLTLMPLDDHRMRLFLRKYIDDTERTDQVFIELHTVPPQVLEACRTPLILFMLSRALASLPNKSVPRNTASIFDGFVQQLYSDNHIPIPERDKLSNALQKLAFSMVDSRMLSTAVTDSWITTNVPADLTDSIFRYGQVSGIIDFSPLHGYKFSHHMLQEFFAGCGLAEAFNSRQNTEPIFSNFWWEEVIISASTLVESPDDFVISVLGDNNNYLFSEILQEAFTTAEGKKNLEVLGYLCERVVETPSYQHHVQESIVEFYRRIFISGRDQMTKYKAYDRRLLLCTRIVGMLGNRLSTKTVAQVNQCLDDRLVFGDIYQRAGIIENSRYLNEKDSIRLLNWVISSRTSVNRFYNFSPADISDIKTSLYSFFCELNSQNRLPILEERFWLRELAFVTLASIQTENARGEIIRLILNDPSVLTFLGEIFPVISLDLFKPFIREMFKQKLIRSLMVWSLILLIAVILSSIFGVETVIRYMTILFPVLAMGGFVIYLINKLVALTRNKDRQAGKQQATKRISIRKHPSSSEITLKDFIYGFVGLAFIGLILILGVLPFIGLAILVLLITAFVPIAKAYFQFFSEPAKREDFSSRVFNSRARDKLLKLVAGYIFSLPFTGFFLLYPDLLAPKGWTLGIVSKWMLQQVGLPPTVLVLAFAWMAVVISLLYFPLVAFTCYTIVGSYVQLLDIYRLKNRLMKNQSEQSYRQIDQHLIKIVNNPNRWGVARARAIQAISQSPFAQEHLPTLEKLTDAESHTAFPIREAAERAIYEIKRREEKYSRLIETTVLRSLDQVNHPLTAVQSKTEEGDNMNSISLLEQGVDFVLITALAEERNMLLSKLPKHYKLPPQKDDIRTYYQAKLPITFSDNSKGNYHLIIMSLLGMGRVQAAMATADAIQKWRPRYVILIGIAGGMQERGVALGDILIADQIVDYEQQKVTPSGPEIRWDVHRSDPRLLDACYNFTESGWQNSTVERPIPGKPKQYFGPIASGDKVIAFSDILKRYRDVWPKLIGVEMEAAGVATATFQSPEAPGFFMIRGVSDLADEDKGAPDVERWRSYACDIAASFTVAFLNSGPVPSEH